jgi:tRNA modification GTPase
MRSKIIYEMAYIESALDDPENYDLTGYKDRIMPICDKIIRNCDKLIKSADEGRVRATGLSTVIIGKPNSGKSSLLNVLTGEETAIVTDIAGTTRDVIEHDVKLGNILLHVIDTAGIRDSADKIEAIGVEKARKYAREAELILYMIDSTSQINDEDIEILTSVKDKKIIVLLNKTDKEDEIIITKDNISKLLETVGVSSDVPVITTSMILGNGIDELKNAISDLFFNGKLVPEDEIYVTNLRHKNLLEKAYRSLCLVKNSVEQGLSEDFYTIDLHDAYESLGLIIGEEVGDDLVEEIFSKFCMGK